MRAGESRELRGIGPGIEARLRELIETGQIAELAELERELAPDLVGLGRYLGLSAKRSVELARSLGVRTAEELREAAAAGRLRSVPGIGPKTEARLLEALAREGEPRPRQGLLLNRARGARRRRSRRRSAATSAGDVRRWRDSCEQLAVVCAAPEPGPVLARFAELPQIVALLEQRRAARGRGDHRGRAGRAGRRRARALRDRTGPRDRLGRLRRRARAAARRARRGSASTRRCGLPWCPPELREQPFAGEPPALVELDQIRGDLHCHTHLVGRTGERRGDGPGRAASAATSTWRSAITRRRWAPCAASPPTMSAARARRSPPPTSCWRRSACCAGSSATSSPTGGSISPTTSSRSSTGSRQASTADSGCRAAEMTKRVEEALRNPYVRCLSHPTGRYINRRPENALDLDRVFEVALEQRRRARGQRPPAPPRPQRRARPRRARRRRADRVLDRRALDLRAREHGAVGRDRAPRLGDRRGRRQPRPSSRSWDRRAKGGHLKEGAGCGATPRMRRQPDATPIPVT